MSERFDWMAEARVAGIRYVEPPAHFVAKPWEDCAETTSYDPKTIGDVPLYLTQRDAAVIFGIKGNFPTRYGEHPRTIADVPAWAAKHGLKIDTKALEEVRKDLWRGFMNPLMPMWAVDSILGLERIQVRALVVELGKFPRTLDEFWAWVEHHKLKTTGTKEEIRKDIQRRTLSAIKEAMNEDRDPFALLRNFRAAL